MDKLNNDSGVLPYGSLKKTNTIDLIVREKIKHDQLIKKYIKELKIIVNCISDGLILIDRFSKFHFLNDSGKKFFYQPESIKYNGDGFAHTQYFDLNGNQLSIEEMVGSRTLKGETILNEKIKAVRPDSAIYMSVNGNPVYDDHHQVLFAIICIRDITEEIDHICLIAKQNEHLLQIEKEKNDALLSAMKLKDDFLYLITHEFRTPIAVVNSALQAIDLICKDDVSPKVSKYLNTIRQNTNRQLRLVNNLLDNIRIRAGNIKLNYSKFDVVFVTGEIIKSVELYSKQKRLTIEFNSSVKRKRVILDEEKYERILLNLLSNALKFTPKGKKITVFLSLKSRNNRSMICLIIKDEGIGIPKEMHQVIFERFGQADSIVSRKAEGTGLGLHLVKQIVVALEGEIELESEDGIGSKFTVFLPVKSEADLTAVQENTLIMKEDNSRIEQAVSIEFSDIYCNR